MARREYLDFDLLVEPEGDGQFAARVTNSPAGEGSTLFRLPFNDLEIENYLLRFSRARATMRRIDSPELEAARKFGSELFGAVFVGEVMNAYLLSRAAAETNGKGLRIRLRLTDSPGLVDLPWELLFDPGAQRDFVALSEHTPVVRYPQMPSPVKPLAVSPPLRILMVVSSPTDYDELDVSGEEGLLREALSELIDDGLVEISLLKPATLSALHSFLDRQEVHVLHYIGHGGYDAARQEGVLVMVGAEGRGRKVEASRLGTILNDHDQLRLVVLNACEGSRSGIEDPFSGVAAEIARRGAPAVIAMQFEITDEAAKAFSHAFYVAIANRYPVDAAVASARKAMFAAGDNIEWATPVLYLRSTDGVVFDLKGTPPKPVPPPLPPGPPPPPLIEPPRPPKTLDVLEVFEKALAAVEAKSWTEARHLLQKVVELDADHADAKAQLGLVENRVQARMLIEEGRAAHAAGDWEQAVAAFTEAAELDPDFEDEDGLRAEAEWRLSMKGPADEAPESDTPPAPTPAPLPAPSVAVPPRPPAPGRRRKSGWAIAALLGALFVLLLIFTTGLFGADPDVSTTDTSAGSGTTLGSAPVSTVGPEELPFADVTAVRFPLPPAIDAGGSEWTFSFQAESVQPVAPTEFFEEAPSAGWWIGWDEEALYLFVDAIDPTGVVQPWGERPDQLWRGDAAHFEFGSDPGGREPSEGLRAEDVHVLLGPRVTADPSGALAAINRVADGTFAAGPSEPRIEVSSFLTPKPGYLLEARIPWSLLNVSEPRVGLVFGMNLNISDSDGVEDLRVMVSSNPLRTGENQTHPGTWNTMVLGP